MIFVSNQITTKPLPDFEQQLAAYNELTQSLSEEFDRTAELHAQALQTAWESYGEYCNDLSILKDPQEFFLRSSNQLHVFAQLGQQYLHALVAVNQQIQEKFLALGQAISPMMLNSVVELTPAATSIDVLDKTVKATNAKTTDLKDINVVHQTEAPAAVSAAAITTATPKQRKKTIVATDVELKTAKNNTINAQATQKARKVTTKKTESTDSNAHAIPAETAAPIKKSAVVGLPSKPVTRAGFAGAAGQPDYKAKSSKATGAKKRVRQ